jgi:transcriptional regulator with AAA-type ATPase domain/tetratricopeptide (TPR) repeat protein
MDELDELFGQSPAMETVRETIRRLVARQQPGRRLPAILIQGETGSGKGLVAHLIHRLGPRSRGPFVDVNCAAIPEPLLEAELFGFERGAFTDARRAKAGLFQTAHQGTLFLDEIALLPEVLQAKLLTVIEERAVRRLGSTRSEPADAWIVSATNADLPAAIRERRFREDLYHRLAVLTIRLPPLREREGDTLLLAERFLARVCTDYGLPPKTLASDARDRLMAYSWPGNVRELANVIERAALQTDGSTVSAKHLELREDPSLTSAGAREPVGPAGVSMDDAMRDHLRATLEQTGWNISRTAAILRISRNTLRSRIEKLGLRGATEASAPARPDERSTPPPAPRMGFAPDDTPAKVIPTVRSTSATLPQIRWERRRITLMRVSLNVPDGSEELPDTSRALEMLVDKIRNFGGRIEEIGHTGLDASFGLEPVEDAPRRAANAAMAILNAATRVQDAVAPGIRVVLHIGACTVGLVNGTLQIDQRAKREASAILDSLVSAAEPNSALISAATAPFLERRFELIPAGSAAANTGLPYRLGAREGTALPSWARTAKFVGRRDELDLMKTRWTSAAQGRGQIVALVGEPGIGKSRLAREFINSKADSPARCLETAAIAGANPTPYLAIIELLKHYFRFDPSEDPDRVRGQIEERLRALDESLIPALPALLTLLDLPVADSQWDAIDPSQRRQRIFDAVKRLLLREARRQPLLLVFEDMHWTDAETQSLLATIVEGLPTSPVLLLLTYRPEYQHGWGSKSFYTQIRVDPLPTERAQELLTALLGEDPTLAPLGPVLIDWTEGNPFFLEESVRALIETGALTGEPGAYRLARPVTTIQVPPTVEEVLAARIDRLIGEERRLLQSAAVIGKDVPYPILAAIADLPEEGLGESLRRLQAAEFLYETADSPEPAYTFKHALTHEVTYGSIVHGKRSLHARVVDVIETLYRDRIEEQVDRLAFHAFHGQVWRKAIGYLRRAGDRAFARSANRQAARFYEQATQAIGHLEWSPELREQAIDLRLALRNALSLLGEAPRTLVYLREARALAEEAGDTRRLGRALSFETNCLYLLGEYKKAIDTGTRARALAEDLGDLAMRMATDMYLGRAHQALGDYHRAIDVFSNVVDSLTGELVWDHLGLPILPAVFARSHIVACQAEIGAFREAMGLADEAIRLAETTGHPDTMLWAYRGAGFLHLGSGDGPKAVEVLQRALALIEAADLPVYVPPISAELGSAYALAGRADQAVPLLEHAVDLALARQQKASLPPILLRMGEVNLAASRLKEARESATRALELFRAQSERGNEAHGLRLLGEIASRENDVDAAEASYAEAMALAREHGMRPLVARGRLGLGLLWQRRGEFAQARSDLGESVRLLREMAMTGWLEKAELALGSLP